MIDKKGLKSKLSKLIKDFRKKNAWDSSSEEEIQSLFTIPLLESLGWKKTSIVINKRQDVKTGKIPDILLKDDSFSTMMVIESKDASKIQMLDGRYFNKTFIEQLFGYSKAEGIWWGILTNFVEWRVYSVYQSRLYEEKKYAFYDLLWANVDRSKYVDILSDEGLEFILKLSKDNLVQEQGRWSRNSIYYPQQEEIKEDFFFKLKTWRANLRTHIRKLCGEQFSIDEVDLITQKIIDRLIFIDYCADNAILSQNRLAAILQRPQDKWKELQRIFIDMDDKFNTELFSPAPCDDLRIEDSIITSIVVELSAIDFNKLSVHIMGEVYEDYLGEILKKSHGGIKIETDSASKKKRSLGIYYTPDYIVNYIVENTVGKLLAKCKTEREINNIRVLDPACGSGSFLIRVFDEFKKHYMRINNYQSNLFEFEIRKKILQNNIFGVDLDAKAVEITKLNLMIKALEGICWQDIRGKKLLPSLELNIRCGNSLVFGNLEIEKSSLFGKEYQNAQNALIALKKSFNNSKSDTEKNSILQEIRINEHTINAKANEYFVHYFKKLDEIKPFNYLSAFPEVFECGGFDAVIGNPPYLNVERVPKEQKKFFLERYSTFYKRYDVFALFFEAALTRLVNDNGAVAFIVPQQIANNLSYKKLRNLFLDTHLLQEACYLGDKVFTAHNDVCILFLKKPHVNMIRLVNALDFNKPIISDVKLDHFKKYDGVISFTSDAKSEKIFDKIFHSQHEPLNKYFDIFQGIVTGNNTAFLPTPDQVRDSKIEKVLLCPVLLGRDFEKWSIRSADRRIIYTNSKTDIKKYHHTEKWLLKFKQDLAERRECKRGIIPWYSLQWPRTKTQLDKIPKILVQGTRNPRLKTRIIATMDEKGFYGTQGINFIVQNNDEISIYYLLGILNSTLINFLFTSKFLNVAIKADYLKEIPLPKASVSEVKEIDKLVHLALRSTDPIEIKSIERRIDRVVYELYRLTPAEIDIVKGEKKG